MTNSSSSKKRIGIAAGGLRFVAETHPDAPGEATTS